MQTLPGFRDFYPEDVAKRNYIFMAFRFIAQKYGFLEIDGPFLEATDLYRKKSGGELIGQLYQFIDKGGRDVALRPEMTPTIARMVIASEKRYRKPLKWFSIGSFFRHERQQKGRLREFAQFNCDLIGDASPAADAELLALAIDTLRLLGFTSHDFLLRLSDRNAWVNFFRKKAADENRIEELLQVVDKMERQPEEETEKQLNTFGIKLQEVHDFIEEGDPDSFRELLAELDARGLSEYVEVDLKIVRGLAYYTGAVFEIFDRKKHFRAVAGGGRYDRLISTLSDGKVDLSAIGFGMGDVILREMIEAVPSAKKVMCDFLEEKTPCDIYVIIAHEDYRLRAMRVVQTLRENGWNVDFSLTRSRINKQFQTAEQLGAFMSAIVGNEWPEVKLKYMESREERSITLEELAEFTKDEDDEFEINE